MSFSLRLPLTFPGTISLPVPRRAEKEKRGMGVRGKNAYCIQEGGRYIGPTIPESWVSERKVHGMKPAPVAKQEPTT